LDLIIYHNACPDGWCAAYLAAKRYPEAVLFPRDHGLEPPYESVEGKNVLVVDFSWRTREQNDKMAALAKSFRILDHHKTAQAVLEGAPYATFDMKRSGAGLTWDELLSVDKGGNFHRRPWYVDYVEDRDLWNWNLPNSRLVSAFLNTVPYTKEAWDALPSLEEAVKSGEGSLRAIDNYVAQVVKQAQLGELCGKKTAVLNVPYAHCSEIGNVLAKEHGLSTTWFERGDGYLQFSLRGNGEVDVSEIAKSFNGGGHHNAAGFQLPLLEGRKILDDILRR
jgi:oligoribonuclease NrnB/cAMP/cGMP phosphodiesterase (DHH superfamily)